MLAYPEALAETLPIFQAAYMSVKPENSLYNRFSAINNLPVTPNHTARQRDINNDLIIVNVSLQSAFQSFSDSN